MNIATKVWRRVTGSGAPGRDVEVRPTDVLVTSYPRSGNTWLRFLITGLLRPDVEPSFAAIRHTVPDVYETSSRDLRRMASPRVLKSHEYFDPRYTRVIYLVRDPRAVLVSYFHYRVKYLGGSPDRSIEEFADDFIAGRVDDYGTWQEHTGSWLGARHDDDRLLLLRYEDLRRDPVVGARRIGAFLELDRTDSDIERAVRFATFDRMRVAEDRELGPESGTNDARFVRRAAASSWEEELPAGVAADVVGSFGRMMRELRYL